MFSVRLVAASTCRNVASFLPPDTSIFITSSSNIIPMGSFRPRPPSIPRPPTHLTPHPAFCRPASTPANSNPDRPQRAQTDHPSRPTTPSPAHQLPVLPRLPLPLATDINFRFCSIRNPLTAATPPSVFQVFTAAFPVPLINMQIICIHHIYLINSFYSSLNGSSQKYSEPDKHALRIINVHLFVR